MKYTRGQFTNMYYRLWEMGLLLPVPTNASIYSVKYRKNDKDEYSRVTLKATSACDALERACYAITYASSWRPEDIDLHAVYDIDENLLWIDEPFYDLVQKKNEFRGMERREFLARFGMTTMAILFGLRPQNANGQFVPFSFVNKILPTTGEQLYATAGSYTWTVPAGLTSVCVVCVGGGGGGGGSGGCLAYKNSIATTPGASVTVIAGAGGTGTTSAGTAGGNGGTSQYGSILSAGGGPGNGTAGTNSGQDGGGIGGLGPSSGSSVYGGYSGGGAGGYSGNGGAAGYASGGSSGSGGGGGGGGWAYSSGGGVGLYGAGSNGAGGASGNGCHGSGGSGGTAGSYTSGGTYGGAGCGYGAGAQAIIPGGPGAVRIIWGVGRSFPSNAT